jgi:hypothetical protein
MNEFELTLKYTNLSTAPQLIVIEPWAEQYWIAHKQCVEIVGKGGVAGSNFEIDQTSEGLVIYGWIDSIVKVFSNGVELEQNKQVNK